MGGLHTLSIKKTGEKKLELEYGDFEIERNVDGFVMED